MPKTLQDIKGGFMAVNPEILEALTAGIQSEVAAYVFYYEAAGKIQRKEFRETIEKLAQEEKKHFHILEGQYDSLVRSEKWNTIADVLRREGLPEISEEMQEKHKDLIAKVREIDSEITILQMALKLEEDARDLFKRLSEQAQSEEGRKTFSHLAGFEEGHVRLVQSMIDRLG
jgi:rubrerythrin